MTLRRGSLRASRFDSSTVEHSDVNERLWVQIPFEAPFRRKEHQHGPSGRNQKRRPVLPPHYRQARNAHGDGAGGRRPHLLSAFLSCPCRCSPAVVPWKRNLREDRFVAASVARNGLPHFTGASFNGRTAFLYSAYIRSIRIAPTIGSVQAALPELFSPFWQSGKTLDGPDRRAHGEHSLGAGPQEPRAGRCNSGRPHQTET